MMMVMILVLKLIMVSWQLGRHGPTEVRGVQEGAGFGPTRRRDSDGATWRDGAWMCVLAFVRGDNCGGVVGGPLYALFDAATGASAPVIAPVCNVIA